MSMIQQICNNIPATATKIGAPILLNASPFLGGQGRNVRVKTSQSPTGAAIWSFQGNARRADNAVPADNDAGWADLAAFDATAGLTTPTNDTFITAGTGGTLVHSTTYYYRVSALNAYGETLASTETSLATASNGSADTSTITVKWLAVAGATGYKVYGRSTGAELLIGTVGAVLLFVDTGAVTPAGALPAANTTAAPSTQEVACPYWGRYNITTLGAGELSMYLEGTQ